jgi:hypothetical protein
MRPEFQYPAREFELWTPLFIPGVVLKLRGDNSYLCVARLKPGVAIEQARAHMNVVAGNLARDYPKTNKDVRVLVGPMLNDITGSVRRALWVLLVAAGVLFLAGCIKQVDHFRDGGFWRSLWRMGGSTAVTPQHAVSAARRLAEQSLKPAVTWFDWYSHAYEEKSLAHAEPFFSPGIFDSASNQAQNFRLPCPNTPEFFKCYVEPVHEIADWCEKFALSVKFMSEWHEGETSTEKATAVEQSYQLLSGLAHSTAPSFQFNRERNKVAEARVSAGLLASYALMFLWDRIDDRRVVQCENCSRHFVSDDLRARYCSGRCRNTSQVRRHRISKTRSRNSTGKGNVNGKKTGTK